MSEPKTIPAKYIFLDVVGFTHDRSVEAQSDIIQVLNGIVESSIKEYGIRKEDVMFLPASDDIGIALLNVGTPYDIHLLIAQRIVKEVYRHSAGTTNKMRKFEVRVGINSNTDNLITDINGNQNIAGAGVNLVSRIMKLADGNQILVSDSVFNDLLHYEKYNSSFKPFRANFKQGLELPVYQFISNGYEGLNTAIPRALQTPSKVEYQPAEPVSQTPPKRENKIEIIKPATGPLPITQFPQAKTASSVTQSYLKGILPEPERTAPGKTEWIKNKTETETLTFLEQSAPPRQNRSLIWASLVILMFGGASFGTWFWMNRQPVLNAGKPSVNTTGKTTTDTPVNNSTAAPASTAPNQTVTETASALKPDAPFTPNPATATRARNNPVRTQPRQATQRLFAARPIIQRTVAQRPKPQPKKEVVKANKPKPSKRITLDDLISDN
jgi:hypothetical protein